MKNRKRITRLEKIGKKEIRQQNKEPAASDDGNSKKRPVRILLADWQNLSRQGLRILIEQQPELKVIAEADNGRIAVQLAKYHKPNIVIMSIDMPELNGIDASRIILSDSPDTKVIALASNYNRQYVKGMIQAGASGFLIKDCFFDELAHAIRLVIQNRRYLSEKIADIVMRELAEQLTSTDKEQMPSLTIREREVLQLVAEGIKTKDIAERLFVSSKTIEAHRRQVMEKLNLPSIAHLTKYAIREGLTTLDGQ